MREYHDRLVRDEVSAQIRTDGGKPRVRILRDDAEYLKALRLTLVEEVGEVCTAQTNEKVLQKLADVLEVVEAMAVALGFTPKDLQHVKQGKLDANGGFESRFFLEYVDKPN